MRDDGTNQQRLSLVYEGYHLWYVIRHFGFVINDNKIYFSKLDSIIENDYGDEAIGALYVMNTDGTEQHRINNVMSTNLNLSDDKLYLNNMSDGRMRGLYTISTDGTGMQMIVDEYVYSILVYGNVIFYIGSRNLYSINFDGNDKQKITDFTYNNIFYINIVNDRLYLFIPVSSTMFSIYLDGSDMRINDKGEWSLP